MRGFATLLAVTAAALLTACPDEGSCTQEAKKERVLQIARTWYLFPDRLAPGIDPAAYPDAQSMLDALVAPAVEAGLDKGWNFLSTLSETRTYYEEGKLAGYGLVVLVREEPLGTPHILVSQVFPLSAADEKGFERGDEILAIGRDAATLVPASTILADVNGWREAFGPPSTEGVTRVFEVRTLGGLVESRTVTTRLYDLSPVAYRVEGDVGILVLRTFVSTADDRLAEAMRSFKAARVTKVVVDVRYNRGGLLSTAVKLANLLSASHAGGTMYTVRYNTAHAAYDARVTIAPTADAIQPERIAFITTDASASASELVANVLEPYLGDQVAPRIALVGARTYGKPVGQRAWNVSTCGDVLYLVSLQFQNSQGEGSYFGGLPDVPAAGAPEFTGKLCEAEDDLTQELGSPLEASTAAALRWLADGTCAGAGTATASGRALVSLPKPDRYPVPPRPSLAQLEIPGLF